MYKFEHLICYQGYSIYLDQNWTTMKYKFKSGPEDVLSFELGSVYDTTWISNLVIKEL